MYGDAAVRALSLLYLCLLCFAGTTRDTHSLTQRHSPPSLSHTRTLTLRFPSTMHADFFRRSKQQYGGAVYTYKTASSFMACTFENNEAQVRLCLTNKRLLKRTHTSILFLSLMLLLLMLLLLSYSVVMAMLVGLTSRTATAAVSASGDRRNHHHSSGKRTFLRLMVMIGSLGLRCLDQAALLSWAFTCECRRRL